MKVCAPRAWIVWPPWKPFACARCFDQGYMVRGGPACDCAAGSRVKEQRRQIDKLLDRLEARLLELEASIKKGNR